MNPQPLFQTINAFQFYQLPIYQNLCYQDPFLQKSLLHHIHPEKVQSLPRFIYEQNLNAFNRSFGACKTNFNPPDASWRSFLKVPIDLQERKAQPAGDTSNDLRMQLEEMVKLILSNVNKSNSGEGDNVRALYSKSPILLQIYDKLVMKYYSAKKCREDIVRYILRKAFKVLRTELIKRERVSSKKASLTLCKRYFSSRLQEMKESKMNDEELLEFIMPFQKNSKNRTMNTNFVLEIFSSPEFCAAYERFLLGFEAILQIDNKKKLEKLLDVLVKCVQKNDMGKLGDVNRLPWLDVWLENTKSIAFSLIPKQSLKKNKL